MKIYYSPQAYADLQRIAHYFKKISPVVAKAITNDIQMTIKLVSRHPHIGKPQDRPGTRRAVTTKYGYLVYYGERESGGGLEIATIIHGRQRRPPYDS